MFQDQENPQNWIALNAVNILKTTFIYNICELQDCLMLKKEH